MPHVGPGITAVANPSRVWDVVRGKIGLKSGVTSTRRDAFVFVKEGVPTDSSGGSEDHPGKLGALCWDSTNDDIYVSVLPFSHDGTIHTWLKVWD